MTLVDTTVWSMFLRRDHATGAHVEKLKNILANGEPVYATGFILQELLQGFHGPKSKEKLIEFFSAVPLVVPNRQDHIDASELRNAARRAGVQIGTIDALIAQLSIRHGLTLLTSDEDFTHLKKLSAIRVWQP
jgi:predicted nucleic acid-binding protein